MEEKETVYMVVIQQDGKVEKKPLDTKRTLECLQHEVHGWIERVVFLNEEYIIGDILVDMWVNEEGLYIEDFTDNLKAMKLTGYPCLVGPAVLTKLDMDDEGRTLGFSEKEADDIIGKIG